MNIYIASSWKNQHAVEMMTALLRENGHKVLSFVENNHGEHSKSMPFDEWVMSPDGTQSFEYDTTAATTSDLVVYIAPSGKDAAAELGMAWANKIPIIGLHAKGEDFGLMRRMIKWFDNYHDVLKFISTYQKPIGMIEQLDKMGLWGD